MVRRYSRASGSKDAKNEGVEMTATPNRLINALLEELGLTADMRLGQALGYASSHLCEMRTGARPLNARFILAVYDLTGWSIEKIRALAGITNGVTNGSN